eukprot:1536285-Pleurochrysis_carterae.AAC.1
MPPPSDIFSYFRACKRPLAASPSRQELRSTKRRLVEALSNCEALQMTEAVIRDQARAAQSRDPVPPNLRPYGVPPSTSRSIRPSLVAPR